MGRRYCPSVTWRLLRCSPIALRFECPPLTPKWTFARPHASHNSQHQRVPCFLFSVGSGTAADRSKLLAVELGGVLTDLDQIAIKSSTLVRVEPAKPSSSISARRPSSRTSLLGRVGPLEIANGEQVSPSPRWASECLAFVKRQERLGSWHIPGSQKRLHSAPKRTLEVAAARRELSQNNSRRRA